MWGYPLTHLVPVWFHRGIGVVSSDRIVPVCLIFRHLIIGKSPKYRRIGVTQDFACGVCEKDLARGEKERTREKIVIGIIPYSALKPEHIALSTTHTRPKALSPLI